MGTTTMEAFGIAQSHHDTPDFMRLLNNPSMLAKKKLTTRYYEDMVLKKKLEMRVKGYRTFCISNYTRHNRTPDIIAVSPEGKIIAVEMETIRPYKSSVEALKKRYTLLLMKEQFFDDVIVEGFTVLENLAQDSNMNLEKKSQT